MTKLLPKKLQKNVRNYLLIFSSFILLSAIPYFAGSGLDDAEPMGAYLNANFPSNFPSNFYPFEPVFPNLTFNSPLTFSEIPNGNKIIVGQRNGEIFWFDKNPNVAAKNSVLDLSKKVSTGGEVGFLGLALHPQFGTPGKNYFYVWYATKNEDGTNSLAPFTGHSCDNEESLTNFLVLARYEIDPTTLSAQESSEQILLKLRLTGITHIGGGLLFGDDGFLYLTTGDQTAFKKAQDIVNNLDGGVLRFDVDKDNTKSHPPVRNMPDDHGHSDEITGNGYWIPNDNPFLSPTGANFEEYYSMGHRNPHRMTKDRATGELYIGEIGGSLHEEINVVKKGKNFGWPLYEGLRRSESCVQSLYNDMPHEEPLVTFPRSEANAIIGGFVYRGTEIPELQGKYICADYGNGEEIFTVDINTGAYEQYGNFTSTNIISFGEDKQGELYILKLGASSLYKVTSKNTGLDNYAPQLLSQTGAFSDLANLTLTDGLIPYDLVESFWSDGALKKRWMAIPNDGSHNTAAEKIGYTAVSDWDFPIGSVLVKHFELPVDERNPSITKRLETRFSIKASDGNFYFVTYKWNDQQTDAELLASGLDESINITKADGSSDTQTWSYPSTIDCVSCHNPTTGGVLGATARYLNKDYTYEKTGRTANQLVTLSHLGILDQTISDADTSSILTAKAMDDATASLEEKARSYLDLNCAYCHRPGAGGRGRFDLRLNLNLEQTGLLSASPYLSFGLPNEKIVVPGNVASSILHHRMNSTASGISMPPIAKNKIDATAVQLINDWIGQLDPDPCADRIIMETFNNAPGTSIAELKSFGNYPDAPSLISELTEFRIPVNADDDYGVRVKGLLKAPETGTYYFWIAGDDNVELNLSSDATEANKTRIAYHDSWTFDTEWDKFATQKSAGVDLIAGQNYYIEALMNERGSGDNLSVGWRKPSHGNGTAPFQVIPCTAFDYFNGSPVVNVESVSLDVESVTLVAGSSQTLIATVSPEDADDTSVVWSSSNTNIATVAANGAVLTVAEGTATITVTTNDGSFSATALITVNPLPIVVTDVTLDSNSTTITISGSQQLTATVSPSDADNKLVTWSSSNPNIATVNSTGLVTAIAEGNTTITVTTNEGAFTAESIITVTGPVNGVTVSPQTVNLVEGESKSLTAQVSPSNALDTSVTWFSSDSNIATVNANGRVTAIAAGNATITVTTTDGGFTAESVITVFRPTVNATGVTVSPDTANLNPGNSTALTAQLSPANASNTSVTWASSDTTIATVDADGNVSAIAAGNATITVTTNDGGFTTEATITVVQAIVAVTGITVDPLTVSVTEGSTSVLTAAVSPANASNTSVTWVSSDTTIATVDADGNISAIAVGEAAITVTTNDGGFTAEATITVVQAIVAATGVTVDPLTVSVTEGSTSVLTAVVSPANASNTSVTWVSSDTSIATVDADGNISAIAAGNATITVTTNDGGFSAQTNIIVLVGNGQDCTATGSITMRRYDNIPGISLNNLFNATNFPDSPSTTVELDSFEIPAYVSNNYGAWVSGYICAPETGTYYFWVSGDDYVRLNLSTDDEAVNKTTIAYHNGHTNNRMWDRYDSQKSIGIQLVQGQSYYIEGYMKEGVGGDHFAVGWRKPSDGIGVAPSEIIPGSVLSSDQDSSYEVAVTSVSIDRTFASILEGATTTLVAQVSPSNAANQSVTWQSSDTNIATVTPNGTVTAVSAGNTIITVTSNDGGFRAQSNITVREENDQNCSATGTITMRRYDDIGGISLNNLFLASNFPDNPSSTQELNSFEIPAHVANNYGAWVSGYLCAPETGTYYFWVSGDNHVQLNLSADDDMANSTTIAFHEGHTNTRIWGKYESQKSIAIELEQGRSYYIEAYLKELNGGDHLSVGWSKPSDASSDSPSEVIPGNVLSPNNAQSFPFQASLREFITVSLINIYPNPTSEIINIETSANEKIKWLYMFDSIGKAVMELPQSEFRENQQNHVINVAHLAKGVYTILIITDDLQEHTEKIIVR